MVKTIIITDGDLQKLSLAEGMEESDTTNNIFIISWRSCLCDNTHKQWKREPTITSGNVRTTNRLVFSDLTIVTMLPGQRARITPKWTIETNIRVQKRGFFGWHLERRRIEFSREFNMTHNFQNVNTHTWPDGSWNEYAAWLTGNEGDYSYNSKFQYLPYTAPTYSWTPLGYCFAVRRFAQTGNITNPIINNTYNYYPFPYNNFSGYHPLAPSNSCPPSDILYYL